MHSLKQYYVYLQFLSRPLDKEYVRLLHDIQGEEIPGHYYRGYTIIAKDSKSNQSFDLQVFDYYYILLIVDVNLFL